MASPSIKRIQFPLTLTWVSTDHKVKGLSLEQGVLDFDLRKKRLFGAGQIRTAVNSVKNYDNLYCIVEFIKSEIKVNKDELLEHERLKQNDLFSTLKRGIT